MSQGGTENSVDRNVTVTALPATQLSAAWAKLWDLLNQILRGKINVVMNATLTLRASQTTTTLTDERIGPKSILSFMALTASAATAAQSLYVTGQLKGSCTINHASNAATDQNFTVAIFG